MEANGITLFNDNRRALFGMECPGRTLSVDSEHIQISTGRGVGKVRFPGPLSWDSRIPVFDRHEVCAVGWFVSFEVDPVDSVYSNDNILLGIWK